MLTCFFPALGSRSHPAKENKFTYKVGALMVVMKEQDVGARRGNVWLVVFEREHNKVMLI